MPLATPVDMQDCSRKCKCCKGPNTGKIFLCSQPCTEENEILDSATCQCIVPLGLCDAFRVNVTVFNFTDPGCTADPYPEDYSGSTGKITPILSTSPYLSKPVEFAHVKSNRCTGENCREVDGGGFEAISEEDFLNLVNADFYYGTYDFECGESDALFIIFQNDNDAFYGAYSGARMVMKVSSSYKGDAATWLQLLPTSVKGRCEGSLDVPASQLPISYY